jgi:peptide/nickel transport system substrate-binding protein
VASSELKLTRWPGYWKKGYPKAAGINFVSIGSDNTAYEAVVSGEGQIAEVASLPVVEEAMSNPATKVVEAGNSPYNYEFVALNDKVAPFNNILAREALDYATNRAALIKALYHNLFKPVEGPTGIGELFYYPTVPDFRGYDLAKARQLVHQLHGLSFTIATTTNSQYWSTEVSALAALWHQAGIDAKIDLTSLTQMIHLTQTHNWQAIDASWVVNDPAFGIPIYFASNGEFSGTHDPVLDHLLAKGVAVPNSQRGAVYGQIGERINQQAEAVFLYQNPTYMILGPNVSYPGRNGNDNVEYLSLRR